MNTQLKNEIEQRRQSMALKSMHFNRYLSVRYITAFFFFLFLNWVLAMGLVGTVFITVSALFFITAAVASFEQVKLYNYPTDNAFLSLACYKGLLVGLSLLLCSLFTPLYAKFFPFLNSASSTKQAVVFLISLAILLCLFVLKRLTAIKKREDKQLQRIQAIQAVLN